MICWFDSRQKGRAWIALALLGVACVAHAEETSENLITDGGFEEWETVRPSGVAGSWWLHLTRHAGAAFTHDAEKNILMPKAFGQSAGLKTMQQENADVHGGGRALRLENGIYLRSKAVPLADGDMFVVGFWVKGSAPVQIYPHASGDAQSVVVEVKGKPEKDRWTRIEQRILVAGPKPEGISFRLVATKEALIDDIVVAKVVRSDERDLRPVEDDLQERIAFASDAGGVITVNGSLDEPGWGQAVACGGFRSHVDQSCLAPVQPSFRVIRDEGNLYFGFEIPLAGAEQVLKTLESEPLVNPAGTPLPKIDIWNGRHCLEFFLQAPGQSGYRHYAATLDGYRYDASGKDKEWNGDWECGIRAAADRWFLEVRVPATDLGVERIAPAEGWRLNVCNTQPGGVASTWAAVGFDYHKPFYFGGLIAEPVARWREAKVKGLAERGQQMAPAATALGLRFERRLGKAEAFVDGMRNTAVHESLDGNAATRLYSQINYVDAAYRCMAAELAYATFFTGGNTRGNTRGK